MGAPAYGIHVFDAVAVSGLKKFVMREFVMKSILVLALLVLLSACATYVTPGAGVPLQAASNPDQGDAPATAEPRAPFPARLAMARIQVPGYYTKGSVCHGRGKFCLVTTREIEKAEDIERLARLPMVKGLSDVGLPDSLHSYGDLRSAAANLEADILLLYSFETAFFAAGKTFGPLSVIKPGVLPKKNTRVTTTVTSLLLDVGTGFVYGTAEATASEDNLAAAWRKVESIDAARLRIESAAFQRLVTELEKLWAGVVKQHAGA